MTLFNRCSFALLASCFSLAAASPTIIAARVKEDFTDYIADWSYFKRWQNVTVQWPGIETPAFDASSGAKYSEEAETLEWGCYSMQLDDILSGVTTVMYTATLSPYNESTVACKRSLARYNTVLYGAMLQKSMNHDNVLPIIDYVQSGSKERDNVNGFAIMPYVSEGSLEINLASYTDQDSVNSAFKQILSAAAAVSAAGIIHRNLTPRNFLKDGDTLKLTDFDQATKDTISSQFQVGTIFYQAPEIILMKSDTGFGYTTKADTFSTAMIFLVMSVTGLQSSKPLFELWRDLIVLDNQLWPTSEQVASYLKTKSYAVFEDNDDLLNVVAKSLCKPSERYTPKEFKDAFDQVA